MTSIARGRIAGLARAAAPVALVVCAAGMLLWFPPGQYSFYPQCPVYYFLHLQCPGCGTTRALAALLHGHFVEALRLNTLTTLMVFPATVYGAICYRRYLRGEVFHWPQLPPAALYGALAVAIVFGVLRNLPLPSL